MPTVQVVPLKHGASTLLILTPFGFPNAIAPVAASSAPLWVIVTTTSAPPLILVTVAATFGAYGSVLQPVTASGALADAVLFNS